MSNDPLASFLGNIRKLERPIHPVSLAEFAEVPLLLSWQEPDALRTAEAHITTSLLTQPPSLLDPTLAARVADLAALHVSAEIEGAAAPSGTRVATNPVEFYKQLALDPRNPRLWAWLISEAQRLFPDYFGSQENIVAAIVEVAKERGIDPKEVGKNAALAQELLLTARKKCAAGWSPSPADTSMSTHSPSPQESRESS